MAGRERGEAAKGASRPGDGGGRQGSWVIPVLVALIGAFMSILDSSIVNVAIPTIMHVFNTDTSTVEWVVTIYMLALGVVVPLSGWLGDKLGFKRLYILALALFTFGSLLCTLSWNVDSLIAARVVQALGGGLIMPTTMAMVYRMVPQERIGSAMGVLGIALFVAPAIGPTLGATWWNTLTGAGSLPSTCPSACWGCSFPWCTCPIFPRPGRAAWISAAP